MTTITIPLSDEHALKLKELADRAGVAPEEWVRTNIEEQLSHSEADFAQAAEYVLSKNAELYRRLA